MWRAIGLSIPLLFLSPLSFAQDKGYECRTCEKDCEAQGLVLGERVCVVEGNGTSSLPPLDQPDQQDSSLTGPGAFQSALVHWEFIPVIESLEADGPVSPLDVQRTITADEKAINECFIPLSYPGSGSLNVEIHLAYNGVPIAVNGTADGIAPGQARCILRRAWGYDFPRLAEEADKPGRIHYRVSFVPRRTGAPDPDQLRPQLLLERVSTEQSQLQPELARQLYMKLPTVESCAAGGLRQMPHDLVVTEVQMQWIRHGERFIPSDVDITVTNQTGTRRPPQAMLDCLKSALTTWDLFLSDTSPGLQTIESNFFITTRPAGWYGS